MSKNQPSGKGRRTARRPGNPNGNAQIAELGIKTRFKPGESGNPSGRPKTRIMSEMLASIGNEVDAKSEKTIFQLAAEALLDRVFSGDVQAFKEFADRVEGRSLQTVELTGGLQVQHSRSDWETKLQNATPEEREQMIQEFDDRILAAAANIMAHRNRPDHVKRTEDRMREFNRRTEAGEDPGHVLATMKTPPVGLTPIH
jgi:hypothetical protein